jgi:hypothetical protein
MHDDGAIFLILTLVFLIYEGLVQIRNIKVVGAAAKASAIVSSLFPSNIRARLMDDSNNHRRRRRNNNNKHKNNKHGGKNSKRHSRNRRNNNWM